MIDLSTSYMGLPLRNPLVASSSPICESIDHLRRMEEAGIAAVTLRSLFEEQLQLESEMLHHALLRGTESYSEALSYLPEIHGMSIDSGNYLRHLETAKTVLSIPVIASLNGCTADGWVRFARELQDAGADALELNIYHLPTDPMLTANGVEEREVDLVAAVRAEISIPLAVKLSPFHSSPANIITRFSSAGADAVVLFNRFYQPDFDIENLDVLPNLELSTPSELRLRLRWAAILYGRVDCELAITGGVHSGADVAKCLLAGAQVAMTTSALLGKGINHAALLIKELASWMTHMEYRDIASVRGAMSHRAVRNPGLLERANYMHLLSSYAAEEKR